VAWLSVKKCRDNFTISTYSVILFIIHISAHTGGRSPNYQTSLAVTASLEHVYGESVMIRAKKSV